MNLIRTNNPTQNIKAITNNITAIPKLDSKYMI
jgi:hypothetical protein